MFENLSEKLERSFKVLRGQGKISEINVAETMKEVRRALVDADVNYKVAKDFTNRVKNEALGRNVINALKPNELMVKIVHEELVKLMGGEEAPFNLDGKPAVVLMSGLQGSGKTTFASKLANKLKQEKNKKPLLVACDVYRPAAIEQLKVVGKAVDTPVFEMGTEKPEIIAKKAVDKARDYGYDFVILDTAGRLHVDEALMDELRRITETVEVNDILLVIDSMVGQDAVNIAKAFNDILEIDGVILTKLDGDTRGGAALSVRAVTGKPIMFVGVGEKLDELDEFHPDRMASRILGMGDILSLIERVESEIDQKKAEEAARKLKENKFDMNDLLAQFQQIKKMGSLKSILSMLPGMDKQLRDVDIDDRQMLRIEAIIKSMTAKEREKPDIINASRKRRIAAGSGMKVEDVNKLLNQYDQMRKMFRQMNTKGGKRKMMRGMKMPGGPGNLGF